MMHYGGGLMAVTNRALRHWRFSGMGRLVEQVMAIERSRWQIGTVPNTSLQIPGR
jgi:hypothetical protein